MNQPSQHRLILAPWHAQSLCVLLNSHCFANPHFHLYWAPHSNSSLNHLFLLLPRPVTHSDLPEHRDLLHPIQNP